MMRDEKIRCEKCDLLYEDCPCDKWECGKCFLDEDCFCKWDEDSQEFLPETQYEAQERKWGWKL